MNRKSMIAGWLIAALAVLPALGLASCKTVGTGTKEISVDSDPGGAEVYHDGEKVGTTPTEYQQEYKVVKFPKWGKITLGVLGASVAVVESFAGVFDIIASATLGYSPWLGIGHLALSGGALYGTLRLFKWKPKRHVRPQKFEFELSKEGYETESKSLELAESTTVGVELTPLPMHDSESEAKVASRKKRESTDAGQGETKEEPETGKPETQTEGAKDEEASASTSEGGEQQTAGRASDGDSAAKREDRSDESADKSRSASETAGQPDLLSAEPQPTAYALVVGIENYRELPEPTGAKRDAETVATMFRKTFGVSSDQMRVLTDDEASKGDILAALDWLKESVPEQGRIYFYYSGHGAPLSEEKASYLLPYEATPETLEYTGLALDEVVARMEASKADEVVTFVDACFSGKGGRSVKKEGERPVVPVEGAEPEAKSVVYTASGADQVSGPTEEGDSGLFTHHLVEAIGNGEADIDGDGRITLEEIDTYVTPRVERDAAELSREQKPALETGGEIRDPADVPLTWGLPTD